MRAALINQSIDALFELTSLEHFVVKDSLGTLRLSTVGLPAARPKAHVDDFAVQSEVPPVVGTETDDEEQQRNGVAYKRSERKIGLAEAQFVHGYNWKVDKTRHNEIKT